MGDARWYHTATLLPDGSVLVAGSVSSVSSAELFDPATGIWTATGSMVHGRHDFTATLLANGTVLATAYEGSETAELYDPATGSWSETGSMSDVHLGTYRATLLPDGTVLVTGGVPNRDEVVEMYDPATGMWVRAADPDDGRRYHTATLLPDGTVLVAGGGDNAASAELYIPGTR
jgi:WD40 repeat protein